MSYNRDGSKEEVMLVLRSKGCITLGVVVALLAVGVLLYGTVFGYALYNVGSTEVGVMFHASNPYKVVGPGVWTNLGLFEDIYSVNIAGLPFKMSDAEVLTKDQQRLGVEVAGTVHRPGLEQANILLTNWANYSTFYISDAALVGNDANPGGLMQRLGQQASKVCVGDLQFSEAVVGSARDVLRECIDKELDKLAKGYGLEVRNVVVPNIILGEAVQKKLDDITNARFATLESQQQKLKAEAEAARELAVQQGAIRVEQGRVQEKAKQDAETAKLTKSALEAQNQVISAQKANELLTAQKDLEIAEANRKVAETTAKSSVAQEQAKAEMYGRNPAYVELLKAQSWSAAYSKMDKVLLPPNVNPFMFIGGGITPNVMLPTPQK